MGKLRNEDLSVYFFVKNIIGSYVTSVVDSYPYNEIETGTLIVPSASIEHKLTAEIGGELGAAWFERDWSVDIFASTDTQRDDLGDLLYAALDNAIPIRDYSSGFNADTGKSIIGVDLRIIEYVSPEDRTLKPTYGFGFGNKNKYWRVNVSFSTKSTKAQ